MLALEVGRRLKCVLIVEDEGLVRAAIAGEFQREGWQVLEASTAERALIHLADNSSIGVVFTDIQLGGHLSGWDLAEAIRAVCPGMPVVYTSGKPVVHSRMVSGSHFINKPYEPDAVLNACRLEARRRSRRPSKSSNAAPRKS